MSIARHRLGLASAIIVPVLAALAFAVAAFAHSLPPTPAAPDSVSVQDGVNTGEVIVSWNAVPEAAYYRIGWVAAPDYEVAAAEGKDWLEAFRFTDILNDGHTRFTVNRLTPETQYAFIVASNSSRYGVPAWSGWVLHQTAAQNLDVASGSTTAWRHSSGTVTESGYPDPCVAYYLPYYDDRVGAFLSANTMRYNAGYASSDCVSTIYIYGENHPQYILLMDDTWTVVTASLFNGGKSTLHIDCMTSDDGSENIWQVRMGNAGVLAPETAPYFHLAHNGSVYFHRVFPDIRTIHLTWHLPQAQSSGEAFVDSSRIFVADADHILKELVLASWAYPSISIGVLSSTSYPSEDPVPQGGVYFAMGDIISAIRPHIDAGCRLHFPWDYQHPIAERMLTEAPDLVDMYFQPRPSHP